jgi:hypothetical protein
MNEYLARFFRSRYFAALRGLAPSSSGDIHATLAGTSALTGAIETAADIIKRPEFVASAIGGSHSHGRMAGQVNAANIAAELSGTSTLAGALTAIADVSAQANGTAGHLSAQITAVAQIRADLPGAAALAAQASYTDDVEELMWLLAA